MSIITAYWGLDGMIVLATLIITAYLYMTRKFNYWKKRGVSEVPPMPIFGNFRDCIFLKKSAGNYLKDLYNRGKGIPYIGFYILDKPFLLIRDPKIIKQILIKDFNYFSDRYGSAGTNDRMGYANLFFLKNPAWKILRAKLTPIFSSGKLKKIFELMLQCSNNLDIYLKSLNLEDKGVELEMKDLASNFSTGVVGTTAFGLSVDPLNNPDDEFRKHGKKIFSTEIVRSLEFITMFFIPSIFYLTGMRTFGKEATVFFRKVIWDTITQRIKSGQKRNDLIDTLIELKTSFKDQDIGGFKFSEDDLVAQAAIFFSAGSETSSSVISFTLYEVALQPEIQDGVRKEILDALDETDGKITYDIIMSLSYLDMVLSETLRKYPPLPFLDRTTKETYKVPNNDLVLEKGTPIYVSLLGIQNDPEYFPDPDKFDPERFIEENKHDRPSCVYLPFGNGPHVCIGTRMGLLQSKLALVTILSKYEVTPCKKTIIPMVFNPRATLIASVDGIHLNIRKINAK